MKKVIMSLTLCLASSLSVIAMEPEPAETLAQEGIIVDLSDGTIALTMDSLPVLKQSITIKNMLEDLAGDAYIPLQQFSKEEFKRLLSLLKFVSINPGLSADDFQAALEEYTDQQLVQLIIMANFLDLPYVLNAALKLFTQRLQGYGGDTEKYDTLIGFLKQFPIVADNYAEIKRVLLKNSPIITELLLKVELPFESEPLAYFYEKGDIFSPDGRLVINMSAAAAGKATVYDVASNNKRYDIAFDPIKDNFILAGDCSDKIKFSNNSKWLLSKLNGSLHIRDAETGEIKYSIPVDGSNYYINNQATILCCQISGNYTVLINTQTQQEILRKKDVRFLNFSNDGSKCAFKHVRRSSVNEIVTVSDGSSFEMSEKDILKLFFSNNNALVAVQSTLQAWELYNFETKEYVSMQDDRDFDRCQFSADDSIIFIIPTKASIHINDAETGAKLHVLFSVKHQLLAVDIGESTVKYIAMKIVNQSFGGDDSDDDVDEEVSLVRFTYDLRPFNELREYKNISLEQALLLSAIDASYKNNVPFKLNEFPNLLEIFNNLPTWMKYALQSYVKK